MRRCRLRWAVGCMRSTHSKCRLEVWEQGSGRRQTIIHGPEPDGCIRPRAAAPLSKTSAAAQRGGDHPFAVRSHGSEARAVCPARRARGSDAREGHQRHAQGTRAGVAAGGSEGGRRDVAGPLRREVAEDGGHDAGRLPQRVAGRPRAVPAASREVRDAVG